MKAQETNVHRLLQGTKVFIVPNFQRRYSWRREQWQDLWDDVLAEYGTQHSDDMGETLDGHFLGSVVLHPAGGPASTVARYLVIDGQQRLTTLLVMLAALRDVRVELDEDFAPAEYDNQYLTNPYNPKDLDRLRPTTFDRSAYIETIRDREPTGGIGQAYSWFAAKIKESKVADAPLDFQRLGQTILLRLIVVEISTSQNDSVNNIFNTLNSKGMDLSPADLIRNEFLLNLSNEEADSAYANHWLPMEQTLVTVKTTGSIDDSKLINYFWSQELRYEANMPVKDLFPVFERRLRRLTNQATGAERDAIVLAQIERLHEQSEIYLTILDPDNENGSSKEIPQMVRERLGWLATWGSSPATPVTFAILCALVEGRATTAEAVRALDLLVGFLVRRALAGVPTNNLNRLFSALPSAMESSDSISDLLTNTFVRPGYRWPTDAELMNGVEGTALYLTTKKSQSKFILSRMEEYLEPKEPVEFDELTIEHVLPQTLTDDWEQRIAAAQESVDDARSLVHTLGNLTLTGYNSKLGNMSFDKKRKILGESTVRLSQIVAASSHWLPSNIRDRSRSLAQLATQIWPARALDAKPMEAQTNIVDFNSPEGLRDALNSLPEGSWTTDEALSTALAMSVDEVHKAVLELGPELARVVRTQDGAVPAWFSQSLAESVKAQMQPLDIHDVGSFVGADELAVRAGWADDEKSFALSLTN